MDRSRPDETPIADRLAPPPGGTLRSALRLISAGLAASRRAAPGEDPSAPIRTLVDPRDIYLA